MADAISVTRAGHRTFFKWHRGRRRGSDPVFTGRRIIEGMQLGASVEVDLVIHADDGMAVLHDLSLERETTGSGLVRQTSAETLRGLHLRGNDGQPIADQVMLLEDLAALIARDGAHPEGLLQLDYKEDAAALNPRVIANFAQALRPVARHFILSSGDAVAASPKSELDYLEYRLVLEADRDGFDIIGAFHAHGRRIDAYTVRRADDEGMAVIGRLLELKVDQITTDDPEGVAAALTAD